MKFGPRPQGAPPPPQTGQPPQSPQSPQPPQQQQPQRQSPPGPPPKWPGQSSPNYPPPLPPGPPPPQPGPPPGPRQFAYDDVLNNRGVALLAYLSVFCLIPLLAARNSPFARAHTNQGLILLIGSVIISLVCLVMVFIPGVNIAAAVIYCVMAGVYTIVAIVKIVQCLRGGFSPLWLVGGIRILK